MTLRHRHRSDRSSTVHNGPTMYYLIEAEAHARQAARLVELDPTTNAQREARILYLAAQRIRSRRMELPA